MKPRDPTIPPGQEALVAEMLGRGARLGANADAGAPCAWNGASIGSVDIKSTYLCGGTKHSVLLRHVSQAASAPGEITTRHFVITPEPGTPAGLAEDIAVRVRAQEHAFSWEGFRDPPGRRDPAEEHASGAPRGSIAVGVGLAILIGLLSIGAWRVRRGRGAAASTAGRPARRIPRRVAFAAALGAPLALHSAILALGGAAEQAMSGSTSSVAVALLRHVGWGAALFLTSYLVARAPRPKEARGVRRAAFLAYTLVGYALWLSSQGAAPRFGKFAVLPPNRAFEDARGTGHLSTRFSTNEHGFRVPSFTIEKPPGTKRIALVGDSFVFGIGVNDGETLRDALASSLEKRGPNGHFEVVSLGVPGNNIASHVDMAEEAAESLAPDWIVLCLTWPNDLSRWDFQETVRESTRVGAFSASAFVLGGGIVARLWDAALLEHRPTPAGERHFRSEVKRLKAMLDAAAAPPNVILFTYLPPHNLVVEAAHSLPRARLASASATDEGDFIPGDGHPTAEGNKRFGETLADAILRD